MRFATQVAQVSTPMPTVAQHAHLQLVLKAELQRYNLLALPPKKRKHRQLPLPLPAPKHCDATEELKRGPQRAGPSQQAVPAPAHQRCYQNVEVPLVVADPAATLHREFQQAATLYHNPIGVP